VVPAKALQAFTDLVGFERVRRALDAGCGNGRNAVYLAAKGANVDAVDSSAEALTAAQKRVYKEGLSGRVSLHRADVTRGLPFENDTFDLVLHSYVACHLLDAKDRRAFVDEMARVARTDAYFITLLFPPGDGYYQKLIADRSFQVTDPLNGKQAALYA
jgi:SAM-dependent methyltransferase